ncbi:hypothetical protein [Bacillus niameyensis]|uniref:hypothetical protein n=1 Tax=Bacillus niameyensis TaxID=1522308 RepID=UPI00078587F4|nr:hypothetical protein [Bacillus niameyensis]
MKNFIIENGKKKELTKEELKKLKAKNVTEVIKEMTPDELEAFKKARYEKFIKPLIDGNLEELDRKRR